MGDIQVYVGVAAGILAFAAYPAYVYDTFRGTTRPNRVTWWILTLASTILAFSYYAEGATNTLWLAIAYVLGNLMIAVISLRHGENVWTKLDVTCLIGALGSIVPWWYFNALTGTGNWYWDNTGLASRTTYCYRLRSQNSYGYSSYSNEACGTTQ